MFGLRAQVGLFAFGESCSDKRQQWPQRRAEAQGYPDWWNAEKSAVKSTRTDYTLAYLVFLNKKNIVSGGRDTDIRLSAHTLPGHDKRELWLLDDQTF